GASLIWFDVRDDEGASDLLFQTSDSTWQAYNQWGGNSLYAGSPAGRAYKVSYNRPLTIDSVGGGGGDYSSPLHSEYPMIRWLEANGYNVSYSTDVDTDRRGAELREHKVFLSVGHDEYWSGQQRANVEAAVPMTVSAADAGFRFWRQTSVAKLTGSTTATMGQYIVGYEVDEDVDNRFRPAGLRTISSTTFSTQEHVVSPSGTDVGPG